MNEKELLLKEIQGLIAESQKENVSKTDLEARIAAINKQLEAINSRPNNHEEVKALKDAVDKFTTEMIGIAADLKALKEGPAKKDEQPKTLKDALLDAFMEASKNVPSLITETVDRQGNKKQSIRDYFQKLGNKSTPEITLKVAVDMLESSVVQANVATVRMTDLNPQIVGVPLAVYQHVTNWIPSRPISNKYLSMLVAYSYEDGAGTKTQGSAPSKSSFLLKTVEFVSETVGTYFRLTDETLDDLPEAMAEIARVAPDKIQNSIDGKILSAAGDDTATIKGLYAAAKKTDFASATTYQKIIKGANLVDVVATMALQNEAAGYPADTVVVNPLDLHKIASEKDQLDNSKFDRRIAFDAIGNPIAIAGLMIRKNANQTVNTLAVTSSKKLLIGDRKQMTLEVGYDGNDFKEGYKTVKIGVRLAFGVEDALATTYCSDMATALSDITII